MAARLSRLQRELELLAKDPPTGIAAWPANEDDMTVLKCQINGPEDTPYQGGIFDLDVQIPDRYPFEPPKCRFETKIYHPNIDSSGRICLDTLKMPPNGSWNPSVNVLTVFTTIRLLMAHPNPDDGLMPDITEMYQKDYSQFKRIAKEYTTKYAIQSVKDYTDDTPISGSSSSSSSSGINDTTVSENVDTVNLLPQKRNKDEISNLVGKKENITNKSTSSQEKKYSSDQEDKKPQKKKYDTDLSSSDDDDDDSDDSEDDSEDDDDDADDDEPETKKKKTL